MAGAIMACPLQDDHDHHLPRRPRNRARRPGTCPWALDAVQMSMEDGARGMEGLADLLQDIITECEQATDEG
jgi:hypothetical protein